jgi:hypothetical protein
MTLIGTNSHPSHLCYRFYLTFSSSYSRPINYGVIKLSSLLYYLLYCPVISVFSSDSFSKTIIGCSSFNVIENEHSAYF